MSKFYIYDAEARKRAKFKCDGQEVDSPESFDSKEEAFKYLTARVSCPIRLLFQYEIVEG